MKIEDFKRTALLASSASALALCLSTSASAAEWELTVGGYFESNIGFSSYDSATATDFDGFSATGSSEIYFRPAITLDNGIKIGARVDLEGHAGERNAGAEFDEAHVFVKGSFGEILIGKSDTPGNHMSYGAPDGYGPDVNLVGLSSGSLSSYIHFNGVHNNVFTGDDVFRGSLGSTHLSNAGEDTVGRITYFTPRFAGFQLGASYAPEEPNDAPNRENLFDVSLNYANTFGGIDLGFSGFYGVADHNTDPNANPEVYGFGAQFGYGGITIGGSFAEFNGSSLENTDGHSFEFGGKYQTGDWGFSAIYFHGQNQDNEHPGFGPQERLQAFTFATNYYVTGHPSRETQPPRPGAGYEAGYGLKQGVDLNLYGFISYVKFSEDVGDGGFGTPGDDLDGFVIGTGFNLSF